MLDDSINCHSVDVGCIVGCVGAGRVHVPRSAASRLASALAVRMPASASVVWTCCVGAGCIDAGCADAGDVGCIDACLDAGCIDVCGGVGWA